MARMGGCAPSPGSIASAHTVPYCAKPFGQPLPPPWCEPASWILPSLCEPLTSERQPLFASTLTSGIQRLSTCPAGR